MNREFLKNAGVSDEAIDKIMAEYGKDLQAEKEKAQKAVVDLEDRDRLIETYKSKLADLEKNSGDNEAVKKELDDLKAKIAADKAAAEEAERDAALTATIRAAMPEGRKFINKFTEQAVIAQIKGEITKKENAGKGVSEILDTLTKDQPGIWENPNQIRDMGGMKDVAPEAVDDAKMRRVMGLPAEK